LLPDKTPLTSFTPIVNNSAFDISTSKSMMFHYKIKQTGNNLAASDAANQINIYKSWMNTFTVDLNDNKRDQTLKDNFIKKTFNVK
jgi:hypothetical protein